MVHPLFHIVYLVWDDLLSVCAIRDDYKQITANGTKAGIKPTTVGMAGVWRYLLAAVILICASMLDPAEAVGGAKSRPRPQKRPPKKPKVEPTDSTPPAQNVDMQRVRRMQITHRAKGLNRFNSCWLNFRGVQLTATHLTFALLTDWTCSVSQWWGNKGIFNETQIKQAIRIPQYIKYKCSSSFCTTLVPQQKPSTEESARIASHLWWDSSLFILYSTDDGDVAPADHSLQMLLPDKPRNQGGTHSDDPGTLLWPNSVC